MTEEDDTMTAEDDIHDLPEIITALGEPDAVITEAGLAHLFGRCAVSVKRAVERGELPPPVRLFGQNTWTAGVIVAHLEQRLKIAAKEAAQLQGKIRALSP